MLLASDDGQYWIEVERKNELKRRSLNSDCSKWRDEDWRDGNIIFQQILTPKFPNLLF